MYICGSCGGRNGLYSSELALRKRHVGLTENYDHLKIYVLSPLTVKGEGTNPTKSLSAAQLACSSYMPIVNAHC